MTKQYVKLAVITSVFFLFYALGITWEEASAETEYYYGGFFNLTFIIALLFFVAIYGIYSYGKTKSIILPNLMLMLHIVFYCSWIFCFTPRPNKIFDIAFIIEILKDSLTFVGISVFFGLLAMLIMWISKKISNTQGDGSVVLTR